MSFAEDYSAYFKDFGVIAMGGTCTVNAVSTEGIFDKEYGEIFNMDGNKPVLLIKTSDIGSAVRGSAVVVNAASYTIAGIEPDGQGMTRLILEA